MVTKFKIFEGLLQKTTLRDFEKKNEWLIKIVKKLDSKFGSEFFYDDDRWKVDDNLLIDLNRTIGYIELINYKDYHLVKVIDKVAWDEDDYDFFKKILSKKTAKKFKI